MFFMVVFHEKHLHYPLWIWPSGVSDACFAAGAQYLLENTTHVPFYLTIHVYRSAIRDGTANTTHTKNAENILIAQRLKWCTFSPLLYSTCVFCAARSAHSEFNPIVRARGILIKYSHMHERLQRAGWCGATTKPESICERRARVTHTHGCKNTAVLIIIWVAAGLLWWLNKPRHFGGPIVCRV